MRKKSSDSVKVFYPKLNREEIILKLRDKIGNLDNILPLRLACLFGSYATGKYTVASDIDILIIYKGEKREEDYALAKTIIDIPRLEPHVYSETEYEKMKKTIDKMMEKGVVIKSEI